MKTVKAMAAELGTAPSVGAALERQLSRLRAPSPAVPRRRRGRAVLGALAALAIAVPFIGLHVPWVLPGNVDVLSSVGTLQVLGLCFVFATVALGYDVLFGYTGLLSFGQVLYFAEGAYVFDIALSDWHWPALAGLALTLAAGAVLGVSLGLVCLRTSGIAFAMVTLAFAQAGYYLIEDNPHNLTGGDTGLVLDTSRLPSLFVGVANTRDLYWLALGCLALAYAATWALTESGMGRVWLAIRENERRLSVLGLSPLPFKLASFVAGSFLAVIGGIVYVLLVGTVEPSAVASTTVTVSVLIMVVLGGAGRRWGAVLGAFVYVYLQQLLLKVAAEPSFASLPGAVRVPLSQPDFLLGAVFVLFVVFAPGGMAGLADQLRSAVARRRRAN
jgi:branched-chain amino acid transport system permease protein